MSLGWIELLISVIIFLFFFIWFLIKWFILRFSAFSLQRNTFLQKSLFQKSCYFWQAWIAIIFFITTIIFLIQILK